MRLARIVLSDAASSDILEQADWYEEQADPRLAQRWEKAVSSTVLRIAKNPLAGTPCHFRQAALAGVRRVAVTDFQKHLVFYRLQEGSVMILRVIHGARDLESLF